MFAFGSFELDADRRQLRRDGAPIALSSRAFDILVLLIECRDRVVTKEEIMIRVWRGMIVEDNNLAVQISALRRALADGPESPSWIMTVPGQGYRFVGRRDVPGADLPAPEPVAAAQPPAFVPAAQPPAFVPAALPPAFVPAAAAASAPVPPPRLAPRLPILTAVLATAALALAAFVMLRPAPSIPPAALLPAPPRLSIAVLPFRDLSDDRCCDYLADAISDDLTTDLSLIPGSVVIARESSDVYRGHPAPAGEIGRKLGVRYLLEGSLRAVDGAFSINAQLIETVGGTHIWAERFTVPRAHLADAQNAIVQRLGSALGVKLVDIEGARSVHDHPDDPDALDLFLRARSILDRSGALDAMSQAQVLLERALTQQPDNVPAASELGWLLVRKIHNYVTPHRDRDLGEARAVVARATQLAPRDPDVLSATAALQLFDNDCASAEVTDHAALEGNPHSVKALTGLIFCKFQLGKFADAASSLAALLKIDPEGSRQKTSLYQMGFAELMMGRPAEALPWLDRSLSIDSENSSSTVGLGLTEWTRASLIAATRLAGDTRTSHSLYASYKGVWPYRSTWTLASRSPRGYADVAGFETFLGALEAEGMPRYVDESVGSLVGSCTASDFAPVPHAVPRTETIGTAALAALIASGKQVIVDFGYGAAVPPSASLSTLDPTSASEVALLQAQLSAARGDKIVVMANGPLDPRACQAALALSHAGMDVAWYRGGEEAWAQAGQPARDLR